MRRVVSVAATALALVAIAMTAPAQAKPSLAPYKGAGAWLDIYDGPTLKKPQAVVDKLATNGVKTLYLETANFKQAANVDIVFPVQTGQLIELAHARGIKVVAWYLPSFANLDRDLRRTLAAINFTTPTGQHFDSFGLDIEAGIVTPIAKRNTAMLELSRRIRAAVGPEYALAAIVPDQRSSSTPPALWPFFPYAQVAPLYDVFLPMSYSSVRAEGAIGVYRYTRANIDFIRARSGKRKARIHVIGGLANTLDAGEAKAVVQAARDGKALGASFYDLPLTGPEEFSALRKLR